MTGEDSSLAWIGVDMVGESERSEARYWMYSGQSQPRLSNYEVIRQASKTVR